MKSFYYLGSIITVNGDINYVSLGNNGVKCHKEKPVYNENTNDYVSKDSYEIKVDYFRKNIGVKDSLLAVKNNSFKVNVIDYLAINRMKNDLLKCCLFDADDAFFDYLEKHSYMTSGVLDYLRSLTKVITFNGINYRVKKSIKFVTTDKNGSVYGFTDKPERGEKEWFASKGNTICLSEYYPNWEASLIEV